MSWRLAGTSATTVARRLTAWHCVDPADAAIITRYAQAEGSHHIPGGDGRRLTFIDGTWYITRKDGT